MTKHTFNNVIVERVEIVSNTIIITVNFGGNSNLKCYSNKRGWFSDAIKMSICNINLEHGKVKFYCTYSNTLLAELG